ncbi:unnamed protein product [Clonostachys chloroleuca]|uniref:ERT1/acuK family PAS domain-containing protein n=1 Tax=Clonostachys chloroleuca TaxID=1926264 RepID=A0AA35QAZ6_9HYPO|nr:unnamed protein product [Clonostachys chloroleuca]
MIFFSGEHSVDTAIPVAGFSDAWMTAQNFQDMNNYNPNYMIAPEVSHEFNLLNDFLHTSLLDDTGVAPDDTSQNQALVRAMKQEMLSGFGAGGLAGGAGQAANVPPGAMMPPPNLDGSSGPLAGNAMQMGKDKTGEYYLQAADPSGSDNPEERMLRVLKAKYDAGLLKPFNYINGYARLGKYLDGHIAASSKQKILRTINQFRPKFREKAQGLTDIQLVYVEMWFERQLMDYDRVFASMAVPACCWRRTGEIFRGNKEMAELIHVPVNQLRDGNIALHEILTEESMVRYWEEFGTIAFDPAHDTLLTACSLKHPSDTSDHPVIKCCFSFTIRKDDHKFQSLPPETLAYLRIPPNTTKAMRRFDQATGREKRDKKLQPVIGITFPGARKSRCVLLPLTFVDFARDIHSKLGHPQTSFSGINLQSEINHQINIVTEFSQKSPPVISPRTAKELERNGKDLWNLCIRLRRDNAQSDRPSLLLLRARVFAFHLLEIGRGANRGRRDRESEIVYMAGLVLTLGRLCLDDEDLDSARIIMQKATNYIERLHSLAQEDGPKKNRIGLEADYLVVRIALSWKENRLDVAEHMFSKAEQLANTLEIASLEMMADTLRHVGADLHAKGDLLMAIKWLKRAYNALNSRPLDRLSVEGLDTRLCVCQNLVLSFLKSGSQEHFSEAKDLVSSIESEIGDKPIVLHWKLEMLQQSPPELMDMDNYAGILRRMIRVFDFSDEEFQFLLSHIKKLRNMNSKLACGVLDDLLTHRVLQSNNLAWLDKALVTRVWVSTMESGPFGDSWDTGLLETLDKVHKSSPEPLSPDATGAVQSLLWKKIEATMSCHQYQSADKWCLVALHPIFSNSGPSNQAKFGRKRILCAISLNKPENAYETFGSMAAESQDDCLTRFLMFKASLLDFNHDVALKSIEYLSRCATEANVQEMLYACIRESQQAYDKLCTLTALQAVAENWSSEQASATSLPSILRCCARLIKVIEKENGPGESSSIFSDDICKIFAIGATHAKAGSLSADGKKAFSTIELHWFRKNSFNIGVTNCSSWDMPKIIGVFSSCLDFISCYPDDMPKEDYEELYVMSMRCHFVMGAAKVSLARTEDRLDERLQKYLEVRRHVAAFDLELCKETVGRDEPTVLDLCRKLSILLVFDFEGAVALKSWDDLGNIVRKAEACRDETTLKAMGDCLLRSETPSRVMFSTMRLIVNGIFVLEDFDTQRLGKYLRCIFQVILPLDDTLALQLLGETSYIAREGSQVGSSLPPTDLEWLVATAFNHAVDFFTRGEEDLCQRWALRAIELAGAMEDAGQMSDLLQGKLAKLPFQSRPQANPER